MPNNDRIIVGIDVGTHKICTIVAEADSGRGSQLNVLGVGAVASEGISRGCITDIVKATSAVSHSLEAAERQSGCRILSAYISMSGSHIAAQNSRGMVAVSHPEHIIGQDDANRAIEAARAVSVPPDRDVLHVIPRTYTVDGQEGVRNPVGLSGFRLEVETHVVTVAGTMRETLIRCVQQADVEVDDVVLSPLAAAEAVLTEQEKNMGVVLVDIGHGTTDISIFVEGSVWHTKVIPVGGWHLTNDLVIVCNIPYEAAESLKLQYGQAVMPGMNSLTRPEMPSSNGKSHPHVAPARVYTSNGTSFSASRVPHISTATVQREVELPLYNEDDEQIETMTFEGTPRMVQRAELNGVMAARLDQLFTMIAEEIRRSGYEGLLPAGVALTGGVACMDGIEAMASNKLRMPVRTGRPLRVGGLGEVFENPSYATSVGLVQWGLRQSDLSSLSRGSRSGRKASNFDNKISMLIKWLKSFLPHDS